MNFQTVSPKEYLNKKGIEYREYGKELVTHCLFNNCDDNSTGTEAHLYFSTETGQYECKKCGEKGNLITLARHLGDDFGNSILTNKKDNLKNTNTGFESANKIWQTSSIPPSDFPYLIKKKILPHHSRFSNDRLVLPLYSPDGLLLSLQFIDKNGDKKFLSGGKTAGCYSLIGQTDKILCVAEGFATAASIFEATGYATVIAFSAGNLEKVVMEVKKSYPDTEIIVCGDTDTVGLQKAKEAAETIGAKVAFPIFEPIDKIDNKIPTDFNDLYVLHGSEAVKSSVASATVVTPKFGFTPLNTLLNEPEEVISWVVEGLLPAGGFSIIIAKPKVGKSTLARQAALAVARGEPFLDRSTTKGAVLYVSLEEKRGEIKNHFRLMGATGNEDLGVYVGSIPKDANEWLKKEIELKKPVLVIIDTLFRFATVSDVNDYAKVLSALDPLLELARTQSAHLMGIHHGRKSNGDGADVALGSTAIFGSVDTAIILKRTNNQRTIESQQRYGTDMEAMVLNFDPETKMAILGSTKGEDDILKISEDILESLKTVNKPLTEAEIDGEVSGRTILKRKALRTLVEGEKITRSGDGKRGNPYLYSCFLVPGVYQGQEKQDNQDTNVTENNGANDKSSSKNILF